MARQEKARYWTAVAYPENMQDDWQEKLGDIFGVATAYCIHDKDYLAEYKAKRQSDAERQRKTHVHFLFAFPNTTTYNAALSLVNKLSADGKVCCNKVESCNSVRNTYEYLIHNTETCKKQKKYLYNASERITVNNFDIGAFEQLGTKEKQDMRMELCDDIVKHNFTNFADFYAYARSNYDSSYFEILATNSALFERLTRGNFQRIVKDTK